MIPKQKAKSLIAKNEQATIEFESNHECIRQLSLQFPIINRTGIKRAINLDAEYYGYKWS